MRKNQAHGSEKIKMESSVDRSPARRQGTQANVRILEIRKMALAGSEACLQCFKFEIIKNPNESPEMTCKSLPIVERTRRRPDSLVRPIVGRGGTLNS